MKTTKRPLNKKTKKKSSKQTVKTIKKMTLNNVSKKKKRDITRTIEKRYGILMIIVILVIFVLSGGLFYFQIVKTSIYTEKLKYLTETIVEGQSAPRGRIYDRNHKLLVDNKPKKVIYYKYVAGVTTKDEINYAYKVADMINVDYSSLLDYDLKYFWMKNNMEEANKKITSKEWEDLDSRKLTLDDIQNLKIERITDEDLQSFNERDYEAAYIYYLMNAGYSFDEKVIKNENVTDEEYALISENIDVLKGFNTKLDWEREYLYGDTFKTILGNVSTSQSGIPYELKDEYLDKGYKLNDRVGTSYLEYEYEEYLKGTKNKYELLSNGTKRLISEGSRGNDIVLTIDIDLQMAVEQIIIDNLYAAKNEPNTEFYNRSFVVILDPKTGEVLAMAGKQIVKVNGKYEIYDYTPGVTTSPVVIGSAVKGASHIVGYNTGALKIGEVRNDFCIKIAATPEKCSWTTLGRLNDITALKMSSNSYQYQTAIKVGKGNYVYNKPLYIDSEAFNIYRNTFAEFGLGVSTGIDLPVESYGYKGDTTNSGFLLDFAIGQYDTYTPIQLAQYVATMANNGNRMQVHLLKEVYSPDGNLTNLVYKYEPTIMNTVNTKQEYIDRVKQGFKAVVEPTGTGYGYMPLDINPAGKTGTSQSFVDSNLDDMVDTETLTNTFVGFAPYDNPIFAFAVLSPDVTHYQNKTNYRTQVNQKISYQVSKKFFEIYK